MAGPWKIRIDGTLRDFEDWLGIPVQRMSGVGLPPVEVLSSPLALAPGVIFDGQSWGAREMTLSLNTSASTLAAYHSARQELIKALDSQTGKIADGPTLIELQYQGATVNKKIDVAYQGGLELNNKDGFAETLDLRLFAPDPWFYATSESNTTLDHEDTTANMRQALRRVDWAWDETWGPASVGTLERVETFAFDADYVYVGGLFTNWDGIATADYIARYDKGTGNWESFTATACNNEVYDIKVGPNGDIYVCGLFTSIGGTPANRIAVYNGSTWSALGSGLNNYATKIDFLPNGNLVAIGAFTTAGGGSANRIAEWDGSSWSAYGTGFNDEPTDLFITEQGLVYVCGKFTTADSVTVNRVCYWDGTAFNTVGDGTTIGANNWIYTMAVDTNGDVYVCGTFTNIGGQAISDIGVFRGNNWQKLRDYTWDVAPANVTIAPDGDVYFFGTFSDIDGVFYPGVAIWDGSDLKQIDLHEPSDPSIVIGALEFDGDDLYLGYQDVAVTANVSGDTTIAYAGTAHAYPYITISKTGTGVVDVISIVNVNTGAALFFDYSLLDGETITIELRPWVGIGVTSSFFGSVPSAILPSSDDGAFYLVPGNGSGSNNNVIRTFVRTTSGTATITATIYYTVAYKSVD